MAEWKSVNEELVTRMHDNSFDVFYLKEKIGCFTPFRDKLDECFERLSWGENPIDFNWENEELGKWDFGKNDLCIFEIMEVPDKYNPTLHVYNFLERKTEDNIPLKTTYDEWLNYIRKLWQEILSKTETETFTFSAELAGKMISEQVVVYMDYGNGVVIHETFIKKSRILSPKWDKKTFEITIGKFLEETNANQYADDPLKLDGDPLYMLGDWFTLVRNSHSSYFFIYE